MKKIALLGPSDINYTKKIDERLNMGKEVLWGWTYTLNEEKQEELQKPNFKIFAYESETYGGNGFVTKCYEVKVHKSRYHSNLGPPPEPELVVHREERFKKCRGWFYIERKGRLNPGREWTDFRDYDTGDYLKPINKTGVWLPNHHWITVIDEFECGMGK